MHTDYPNKPKSSTKLSTTVRLCQLFFRIKRVLLLKEGMQRGKMITASFYCSNLQHLRRAIQKKRHADFWSCSTHDNARPHSARITRQQLKQFQLNILEYPSYNPGLAPNDFRFFLN